jgi:hypothetical protein
MGSFLQLRKLSHHYPCNCLHTEHGSYRISGGMLKRHISAVLFVCLVILWCCNKAASFIASNETWRECYEWWWWCWCPVTSIRDRIIIWDSWYILRKLSTFKYLRMLVTSTNDIRDETNIRLFRKCLLPFSSESPRVLSKILTSKYIGGTFAKFVDSPYYSESKLCRGAVTVSFSKYLPWQAIHILQRSTHFSKTCCRPLITSKFLASELPFHGWKRPEIAWGKIWICVRLGKSGWVEPH